MTDLATLGIRVDSRQALEGAENLQKLAVASARAEVAADKLAKAQESGDPGKIARANLEHARATEAVQRATARQTAATEKVVQATTAAGNASAQFAATSRNSTQALTQLSFQINDIGSSLASGISPFQTLAQQGGQVFQVWQQSPTVFGDAARAIGSVITPGRLVGSTLALSAAIAFVAWNRFVEQQLVLERSLSGVGRGAGQTAQSLDRVAVAAAAVGETSVASARDTVAALAATGRIGPAIIGQLASVRRNLAATLGIESADANDLLAKAFSDPAKGAQMFAERLGGLSAAQLQLIQRLSESGRRLEAQRVLLDSITPSIRNASEITSVWAQAWAKVGAAASDAIDYAGRALSTSRDTPGNPDEMLERLRVAMAERDRLLASPPRQGSGIFPNAEARQYNLALQAANTEIERMRSGLEEVGRGQLRAAITAENMARANRSVDAGRVAREVGDPRIAQMETLIGQYNRLRTAIRDQMDEETGARTNREMTDPQLEEAIQARARIRRQIEDMTSRNRNVFQQDGSLAPTDQVMSQLTRYNDLLRERQRVEQMEATAVTLSQRQRAAAARENLNAMEQGATAGDRETTSLRGRIAAENLAVQTAHQLSRAAIERIQSQNDNIAGIKAETAVIGRSIGEQERSRVELQLINEARREYRAQGLTVPEAELQRYRDLARDVGAARQAYAELNLAKDVAFERQQLGMSDDNRQISGRLRSVFGDDYASQMDGPLAQQMRYNLEVERSIQLSTQFASSLVRDLTAGKTFTEALTNSVARLAERLSELALDSAIRSMFGQGGGNRGGGDGNIFGSIISGLGSLFGGFRADGGPVDYGKSYIVGERGPELFSPGRSGMITPNSALGSRRSNDNAPSEPAVIRVYLDDDGRLAAVAENAGRNAAKVEVHRLEARVPGMAQAAVASGKYDRKLGLR
jgi:hypothetical protein